MQKYWTILHIGLIIYCFSRQRPLISQQCGSSPDPADVPFLIERLNGLIGTIRVVRQGQIRTHKIERFRVP